MRGSDKTDRAVAIPAYLSPSSSRLPELFIPGRQPARDHLFLKKYIPAITRAVKPRRIPATTMMNAGDPVSMDGPAACHGHGGGFRELGCGCRAGSVHPARRGIFRGGIPDGRGDRRRGCREGSGGGRRQEREGIDLKVGGPGDHIVALRGEGDPVHGPVEKGGPGT